MERGSDKHSPRVDDAMESDVSGLLTGGRTSGPHGSNLSHDEIERRTELARHLRPGVFPARPGELVETAVAAHAPDWVVTRLDSLPDGLYDHFEAVWEALGGDEDYPRA
jgi:hypothetical protein